MAVYFSLKYISISLKHEETLKALRGSLESILFDLCFPLIEMSVEDLEEFSSDQIKFFHKEEDISNVIGNSKMAAMDIFENAASMCDADNQLFLFKIMNFFAVCLETGRSPRDNSEITDRRRDGIF